MEMAGVVYEVTRLAERYRAATASYEESLELLRRVESRVAAVVAAAEATQPGEEAIHSALALREWLLEDNYAAAAEEAEKLCKLISRDLVASLYAARPEPDTCLDAGEAKLLAAMAQAAGPLAPVVASMVAGGATRLSEVRERGLLVASAWESVARLLTSVYTSAARLEKLLNTPRRATIALVAELVSSPSPVEALEEAARLLSEATGLASEASEALRAASKAAEACGDSSRLHCRLLRSIVEELLAAREELQGLSQSHSLDELRAAIARVAGHIRAAREAAGMVTRLAERLASTKPQGLGEAVALLEKHYSRYSLTRAEEAVLEKLLREGRLDVEALGREEAEAAIRLCRKRVVSCTLRL
jgi:hypothetical protein